jgi:hypothetical protein
LVLGEDFGGAEVDIFDGAVAVEENVCGKKSGEQRYTREK